MTGGKRWRDGTAVEWSGRKKVDVGLEGWRRGGAAGGVRGSVAACLGGVASALVAARPYQ